MLLVGELALLHLISRDRSFLRLLKQDFEKKERVAACKQRRRYQEALLKAEVAGHQPLGRFCSDTCFSICVNSTGLSSMLFVATPCLFTSIKNSLNTNMDCKSILAYQDRHGMVM